MQYLGENQLTIRIRFLPWTPPDTIPKFAARNLEAGLPKYHFSVFFSLLWHPFHFNTPLDLGPHIHISQDDLPLSDYPLLRDREAGSSIPRLSPYPEVRGFPKLDGAGRSDERTSADRSHAWAGFHGREPCSS